VALADQAALGAIEARRLSKTPVKGGGARPKTATGVESSPSKRVGNDQSAFEPVGLLSRGKRNLSGLCGR
jgi:hypothetical protein